MEQIRLEVSHSDDIVKEAFQGMQAGQMPETCREGTNGVYFLKNEKGDKVAVFKPIDEEGQRPPHSPILSRRSPRVPRANMKISDLKNCERTPASSSPKPTRARPTIHCIDQIKSFITNIFRNKKTPKLNEHGIPAGESALREVAAAMIDHDHFYGVPKTAIVKIQHWESLQMKRFLMKFPRISDPEGITKTGSLQEFKENEGSAEEISPSLFPVSEVHKIGILDLHVMNTDRNEGNILVNRAKKNPSKPLISSSYELIPIDHSFCVPNFRHIDGTYFAWLTWPQSKIPFGARALLHIDQIDIERDMALLKNKLGIEEEYLMSMKIGTMLLKKGAKQGLTLYDIGSLASRDLENADEPSPLEVMIATALEMSATSPLTSSSSSPHENGDGDKPSNHKDADTVFSDLHDIENFDINRFFSSLDTIMDETIAQRKKKSTTTACS